MSLIKQNMMELMPDTELVADDRNIASPKINLDVFPNEGSANFGYGQVSSQKQMSFTVGSDYASWLPQESHLEFDLKIGTGAGAQLTGDVSALFDRVRLVTQAGVVLVDDQAHNLIQRITQTCVVNDSYKKTSWMSGRNNLCVPDLELDPLTSSARHYAIELSHNFFKQVRSVPLPITGNLRLIIDLADDQTAFYAADMPTTKYRIDNPRLSVALVPMTADFTDKLRRVAMAGGLAFNYIQNYYISAPATSTSNTVQVNFAMKSAQSVIAVQRLSTQITDTTQDSLNKYQAPAGGLVSIQVRQGSDAFPSTAIDTTERAYCELLKTLDQYLDLDSGSQLSRARYTGADATGANQASTGPLFIAGIKTAKAGMNTGVSTLNGGLQLKWNQATALPNAQLDVFIQYAVIAVVKSPTEVYLEF